MRVIACLVVLGLAASAGVLAAEESWARVENHAFAFSGPASLRKTDAQGADSFAEEFVSDHIRLSFDYGIYSNNFQDWPAETTFEETKVAGRPAKIGTAANPWEKAFPYMTQIHFQLEGRLALSMWAFCKTEKDITLAKRIFTSITFNKGLPNRSPQSTPTAVTPPAGQDARQP
jgi:hypothetical protein